MFESRLYVLFIVRHLGGYFDWQLVLVVVLRLCWWVDSTARRALKNGDLCSIHAPYARPLCQKFCAFPYHITMTTV